jgi:hypothetical protein
VTNAFKYYLPTGRYRVIDEQEFIKIAQNKMMHHTVLQKKYINRDVTKLSALKIFQKLNIKVVPVNALEIEQSEDNTVMKTVEKMEEEIAKYIFDHSTVDYSEFTDYLSGKEEAMIELLENKLNYKVVSEDKTLKEFIEQEVYFTTEITYKKNHITVALSPEKFICNKNDEAIYKYKSTIIDEDGYKFNFKKNELFRYREEAIEEAKKLIDEHYNLPIRNSKIQKIIVRKDDKNTTIVFWPEISTDNNYIISNDVIGNHDLGGETKTSMAYFDTCQEVTARELRNAKKVIEKCMKLQTYNVKHI